VFEKPLPFKLYAQILIFSALVALGALILWPLQQALYGGMIGIRDNLINRLERQIGRKIRYSSISPSLFGSFDVRNISIMGYDDIPLLTMSRFRIAYSLLDILRGNTLAIRSVQIDSPLINYNTATDKDLLDLFKTAGKESSSREFTDMLPEKLIVRIRNGKCQVSSGNINYSLDAFDLNAEIFDKSAVIDGKWNVNVAIAGMFGAPVNFQMVMTANGLCRMDMEDGAAIIAIPSVTGDMTGAESVAFNISMREGVVNIYKKPDDFPFDMSLDYIKDGKSLEGRLSCNNFKLAQMVSFSGGLEGLRQMLDVASSGEAIIRRGNDGSLSYSVDMAGSAALDLPSQDASDAVEIASIGRAASYEIHITGDENLAQFDRFYFSMPRNVVLDAALPEDAARSQDAARPAEAARSSNALFYGGAGFTGNVAFHPFAPQGTISLAGFSTSGREGMDADITVNAVDSKINMSCNAIRIDKSAADIAAKASLEPSEDGMLFSVSAARSADKNDAQKRYISLDGSMSSGLQNVDAVLSLDSFLAGDIIRLASPFVKNIPQPDVLTEVFRNTAITTEITLNKDYSLVSYNAPSLVFHDKSGEGGFSGSASINGNGSSFELDKGQIKRGGEILLLSAQANFTELNNIDFSVNAGYQDLSYSIQGAILDGKTVNITGSYGLNVNLSASRNGVYTGAVRTEGFPVPFLGKPAMLFMAANLRYNSPQAWSMDINRLEMTDMITPGGLAQMRVSGYADQKGINLSQLSYKDGFGPLSGNVNLSWSHDDSNLFSTITGAAYLVDNNKENYQMQVSYINRRLTLGLSGSSIRLGRFSQKANTFQADGEIRMEWDSINSFNADINLSSLRGRINERNININMQAFIDSDELTVRQIGINLNTLHGEIPQIVVNNKTGTAMTNGNLKLALGGKRAEGFMSVNANFKPVQSWLEIGDILDSFDGKAHFENFRMGSETEVQAFDIAFTRGSGGDTNGGGSFLTVFGGPRNMLRLQVDNNGNFYAGLSSPSPIRGTAIGNISGSTINASCKDLYVDAGRLFELLPKRNDIYLSGGYVNASVDIRGPISDPEFFGTARGTSLRFVIPSYIPVELRPIPFSVDIEGNEIHFGPVSASAGKGAGTVSGQFLIDRWIPNIFDINILVPRETPIPYNFGITNFAAHGDASGRMKVSMENQTLDVSGDVYVNNTMLGINSEDTAAPQNAVFTDSDIRYLVNLVINTGPVVEFNYPNSKFPLLKANADMGTKLHVTVDTLTKQYSLISDVKIRGGEIFYFERSFYIRSGMLVLRENERRFSPRLTARAETRDRNEDGPVTISLMVDNAPLFNFTARFESSPSLSQMEILALMGQNIAGASEVDDTAGKYQREMSLINSTADIFAQFTVGRLFERQIRNFLQLDMFSFRTQVLQNLLFRGTGIMQQPIDRNGWANYFDNTTLFGGKYFGPDLFVQGMLSMRYDANKTTFGGMSFQPDIGLELQGPVVFNKFNFRIRWDFVPEHPENWYANDNSITLTVSRSY